MNFIGPEIFILLFGLIGLASFVLTIWAAIEIATKPFVKDKDKVLWLIIVLLVGFIGPVIYLTQRKKLLAQYNTPAGGYDHFDLDQPRPEAQPRGKGWDEDLV